MPCKPASLTAEVSLADPSTKISFSFNALQARSTVSPLVSASPTLSFDLGCDTSMLASSGTVCERLETELMFPAITPAFKSLKKKLADRLKTFGSTRGYSFFLYRAKATYIYTNIYIYTQPKVYKYIHLIQFIHSALHLILLFSSLAGNSSGLMFVILTSTNLYLRWQTIPLRRIMPAESEAGLQHGVHLLG